MKYTLVIIASLLFCFSALAQEVQKQTVTQERQVVKPVTQQKANDSVKIVVTSERTLVKPVDKSGDQQPRKAVILEEKAIVVPAAKVKKQKDD